MWIIMGIEQPSLNAVMARLPNAVVHLASFEVAFGLALVIESPILQMLSAATALVRGRRSYRSMLRFMHAWTIVLTSIHVVVSLPRVFAFVAGRVLSVPEEVLEPSQQLFVLLLPLAAMVGYRRLWQGGLIQAGKTGLVGRTMIIRLSVTIGCLAAGFAAHRIVPDRAPGGHIVAGLSLMAGVIAGAAASWWYFRRHVAIEMFEGGGATSPSNPAPSAAASSAAASSAASSDGDEPKTFAQLLAFYVPLSLTSVMSLASRPILAYGIGRSIAPFLSLAAWPVVQSLLFLFTSIALSYQEAVVAMINRDEANEPVVRRFAVRLAVVLTAIFALMSVTGLSRLWFSHVAGLDAELVELARASLVILIVMPAAATGRSFFSGVLVARHRTALLAVAVAANTATLLTLVVLLPRLTTLAGASVAACAFAGANVVQLLVLAVADLAMRRRLRTRIAAGTL